MRKILEVSDIETIKTLLGSYQTNVQSLEKNFEVSIEPCSEGICVEGAIETQVLKAYSILSRLFNLKQTGYPVDAQTSSYLADTSLRGEMNPLTSYEPELICMTAKGRSIRSKTLGQTRYVDAIRSHEICFATGPAGTGKTFLAVALAVNAFRANEVDRIILTRPAVEAGEKLGFLPGDLQMKVDPYMRPLYDALQELMGAETYLKYMEKGLIEVSPLAYMRGRTLDNAFIILDEAQNTTPQQMKMFLTRIGFGSKVVVTGDVTQVDLPSSQKSGLKGLRYILRNVSGLCFIELKAEDVVRNPLVQRIIEAYEKSDQNSSSSRESHSKARANGIIKR